MELKSEHCVTVMILSVLAIISNWIGKTYYPDDVAVQGGIAFMLLLIVAWFVMGSLGSSQTRNRNDAKKSYGGLALSNYNESFDWGLVSFSLACVGGAIVAGFFILLGISLMVTEKYFMEKSFGIFIIIFVIIAASSIFSEEWGNFKNDKK